MLTPSVGVLTSAHPASGALNISSRPSLSANHAKEASRSLTGVDRVMMPS